MKLKHIFMGTLTALLMVFGVGRAWAADPVAKIGDEMFETLEAAFASDKAKTADVEIELLSNVYLTGELDIVNFHGTLNLGGFELTNDDSWKAGYYDYLIDLYVSDVGKTSSLVVTNGTLTLKDGHMMYVCAGATLTIAADATIAEVGTSNCANPLRIYSKTGGHTGESSDIAGVINVYGKVTRTEAEGNTTGLDNGFIDQCLGPSVVNVYEGAVLSHEGGRGFKMSGGVPTLNIAGGTMTTGTNDMFHITGSASISSINFMGGTFTMGSLFSADGASKSISVNGLGADCTAKFSTTASKVKSLGDYCAVGYLPMLEDDWYVIRPLAVKNVKFQQHYPWNGMVDVSCDLTGAGEATLQVTAFTNGVMCCAATTLVGETTVDLGAAGGTKNGVKLVWNAAADLPANFKATDITIKVSANWSAFLDVQSAAISAAGTLDIVAGDRVAKEEESLVVDPAWGDATTARVAIDGEDAARTYEAVTIDTWETSTLEPGRYVMSFTAGEDNESAAFWKTGADWVVFDSSNITADVTFEAGKTYLVLGTNTIAGGVMLTVEDGAKFEYDQSAPAGFRTGGGGLAELPNRYMTADGLDPADEGNLYQIVEKIKGGEDNPWDIDEGITAHTNGTELVIAGEGTVTKFADVIANWSAVKDGIAVINVSSAGVTGVEDAAFAGLSGVALTLPDGWQGELPDEDGNWYGATEVTLTAVPFAVKNITFAQRWPWNGLVDIDFDLTGPEGEQKAFVTVRDDGTEIANFTATVTIPEGGVANGVRIVWNALAAGLTANFLSDNVTIEVAFHVNEAEIQAEIESRGGVQLWENGPVFAECNLGATKPEESGWYFWWGDTVGYKNNGSAWVSAVDGTTSIQFNSSSISSTQDKSISTLKEEGWIDDSGNLAAEHDAATVKLEAPWRMPTVAELLSLTNAVVCTRVWTENYNGTGVNGYLVTGATEGYTDKSIFLPAAGRGYNNSFDPPGEDGIYRTSTPMDDNDYSAWYLSFNATNFGKDDNNFYRTDGCTVRPVWTLPALEIVKGTSAVGMLDVRSEVALPMGETTISNVMWSSTAWGELPEAAVTLGWTNSVAQTFGTIAADILADGAMDVTLPKIDGVYWLKHSTGDLQSFAAFTVSGYPLGCESNPMSIGTNGDENAVMAVTNGVNVYVMSGRTVVDAAKLKALCAGTVTDGWFVSEDGSSTNRIDMVLGPDGEYYETLSAALAVDPLPETFTLFEVKGYWVSYDKGEDDQGDPQPTGEMETEMFVSTISTNLAANAFVRDDFVFDHWQGWTNGVEVTHLDQAAGVDFITPGETLSLTAQWTRVAVWVAVANVEHATYTVTTNGVPVEMSRVGGENETLWRVATNADVTVTFRADSGYALDSAGNPAAIVLGNVTYGVNDVVVDYPSVLSAENVFTTKDDGSGNLIITGSVPTADGVLIIPSQINGKNVVAIADRAFAWNTWLKELVIEEGVAEIGGAAFDACTALEKVELPASLTKIGMVAFMRCFSLQAVAFKGNAPTIALPAATGYGLFWGAPGLDIVLDAGATGWDAEDVQNTLCQYWQKLEKTANGFRLTFDEEAVKPEVAALTSAAPKTVTLSVANAKPGLFYTVERSETLGGDWQPVARTQSTVDGTISIPAPAEGNKGFYRVVVDDKE